MQIRNNQNDLQRYESFCLGFCCFPDKTSILKSIVMHLPVIHLGSQYYQVLSYTMKKESGPELIAFWSAFLFIEKSSLTYSGSSTVFTSTVISSSLCATSSVMLSWYRPPRCSAKNFSMAATKAILLTGRAKP